VPAGQPIIRSTCADPIGVHVLHLWHSGPHPASTASHRPIGDADVFAARPLARVGRNDRRPDRGRIPGDGPAPPRCPGRGSCSDRPGNVRDNARWDAPRGWSYTRRDCGRMLPSNFRRGVAGTEGTCTMGAWPRSTSRFPSSPPVFIKNTLALGDGGGVCRVAMSAGRAIRWLNPLDSHLETAPQC
jgi:hypothetical protein